MPLHKTPLVRLSDLAKGRLSNLFKLHCDNRPIQDQLAICSHSTYDLGLEQEINVPNDILIKVLRIENDRVRIGIEAPKNINILRDNARNTEISARRLQYG